MICKSRLLPLPATSPRHTPRDGPLEDPTSTTAIAVAYIYILAVFRW